jgi:hypothetical protein
MKGLLSCRQGLTSSLRPAPHAGRSAARPPASCQAAARRRHLLLCRRGGVEVAGFPLGGEMAEYPPCSFLISYYPSLTLTRHSFPYTYSTVLSRRCQWAHIQSSSRYTPNLPAQRRRINQGPGLLPPGEPGRCGRLPVGPHTLSALDQRAGLCYQMWEPLSISSPSCPHSYSYPASSYYALSGSPESHRLV